MVLSLNPCPQLCKKGLWSQDFNYGAKGEDVDQKLCLVCGIVVDRTEPAVVFLIVFCMLFVVAKWMRCALRSFVRR